MLLHGKSTALSDALQSLMLLTPLLLALKDYHHQDVPYNRMALVVQIHEQLRATLSLYPLKVWVTPRNLNLYRSRIVTLLLIIAFFRR